MMLEKKDILLVIPLFNHGSTIARVVRKAQTTGFEILVVDDGSTDNGLKNLKSLECDSIRLEVNQGKGAAILAGAKEARRRGFQAIITVDADDQHNPKEASRLFKKASANWPCCIIGNRIMDQDTAPGSSLFGRAFSNFWVRLETGLELDDTQSGFRLYPVNEMLLLNLTRSRYDFEIEVLVKMAWAGIPIDSVPISVHYPKADERISHFDKFRDNVRLSLLHTRFVIRRLIPLPQPRLIAEDSDQEKVRYGGNPWKILKKLCREYSSPFFLAVAVWLGLFMGALPLIACHTVAIIYVAHRFHLNKIAAVAASQFCMPPVVPVLCIQTGYFLQNGSLLLDLTWKKWGLEVHYRFWDWLLGSLLVGPLLGLIGGSLVYFASKSLHQRKNNASIG